MNQNGVFGIFFVLIVLLLGSFSMFTVEERERAIKFELGKIVKTDFEPGLYFKIPFYNNIRKFDDRILTLDAEPERYLTAEKKNVIVDSFVKWRIDDVKAFYTDLGGDIEQANNRLSLIIKDGLRGEFGKRTIQEVISGERQEIMETISTNAAVQAKKFGLKVVDVRLKRIDLADDISNSVYRRMEAERKRVADELRAEGDKIAKEIFAKADRYVVVTLAKADRESEEIRGRGDAQAAQIYADAYNKNKEFYSFYRSVNAYKASFADESDILVLEPKMEFFKYLKSSEGSKK